MAPLKWLKNVTKQHRVLSKKIEEMERMVSLPMEIADSSEMACSATESTMKVLESLQQSPAQQFLDHMEQRERFNRIAPEIHGHVAVVENGTMAATGEQLARKKQEDREFRQETLAEQRKQNKLMTLGLWIAGLGIVVSIVLAVAFSDLLRSWLGRLSN